MLPGLCLEGRNVASGRTSVQRCSIFPSSLPSSHLLKGGPSPGNTPRALPWSLQNTFSWVTEGGFFFLCFPWDLLATVSSGCLASIGTFLPPPSQCWGADTCPPEGVQGARMARWHLNCACCRMQLGKAPVVHGPSSWLLCEVTCTFSFGSIEADTLIWGPEGPLGRKGHHESCRGRYVWESQIT